MFKVQRSPMKKNSTAVQELLQFVKQTPGLSQAPENVRLNQQGYGNFDLEGLTLTLRGQRYTPQTRRAENYSDQQLLRRIAEYNDENRLVKKQRSNNKRNRRSKESEGKSKRKVRTTITPGKLDEMNKIFQFYQNSKQKQGYSSDFLHFLRQKEDRNKKEDANKDDTEEKKFSSCNLKAIGEYLGLGYSTILHKYRQYRATKKVKGGALLASINQKRKYKKSKEIEALIEKSLNEGKFYTAVDLSKYIEKQYGKTLSRSIISRHLGEMGYSYKGTKSKTVSSECLQVKQSRKKFITMCTFLRDKGYQFFYLGQVVFYPEESQADSQNFFDKVNLTLMISQKGIHKTQIKREPLYQNEFLSFLKQAINYLQADESNAPKIIIMDLQNHLHTCEGVIEIRNQIKQNNIRIFYLSPNCAKLNLIQWVGSNIKERLDYRSHESTEQLWIKLITTIEEMKYATFENEMECVKQYEKKGLKMQNFD